MTAKFTSLAQGGFQQYISLKHVSRRDFHPHRGPPPRAGSHSASDLLPRHPDPHCQSRLSSTEAAQWGLGQLITPGVDRINIPFAEFTALGSTMYTGPSRSTKEGDSPFTNSNQRLRGWPYLAIEAWPSRCPDCGLRQPGGSRIRMVPSGWYCLSRSVRSERRSPSRNMIGLADRRLDRIRIGCGDLVSSGLLLSIDRSRRRLYMLSQLSLRILL